MIPFGSRQVLWPWTMSCAASPRSTCLTRRQIFGLFSARPIGSTNPSDFPPSITPSRQPLTASASLYGIALEWKENPFEWSAPDYYEVHRNFHGGPWSDAVMGMRFAAVAPKQTRVTVFSSITPRNVLGSLMAKSVVSPKSSQDMQKIMLHASQHLSNRVEPMLPNLAATPNREEALQLGLKQLHASAAPKDLSRRLEIWLRQSPDSALTHIRPWVIAREWTADPWKVLSLFLEATRAGLFEFRWEVLCPNCRSTRGEHLKTLAAVPSHSHCELCQIRFDARFDQSVELKFSVHSSIRPVPHAVYCLTGPGDKPHIVGQAIVPPAADKDWTLNSFAAPLRLRSPNVTGTLDLTPEWMASGHGWVVRADPQGFATARGAGKPGCIQLQNRLPHPVQFVFERTAWNQDILTAAQVSGWQEFRDIFPAEVLSPHEQITVGSQVFVFTDLKGSTALYEEIGDPQAYGRVRDHLVTLIRAVRESHGAVVKTLGDAVMAVFGTLTDGLNALDSMHRGLAEGFNQPRQHKPLVLKSSLHAGPCLAVNANGKIDYFGSTVNRAARMVECSSGQDFVVADSVFHRPEMGDWISKHSATAEPLEVKFRGIDPPAKVWRIKAGSTPP